MSIQQDGSRPLRPLRVGRPSGDPPRIGEQNVCGIAGYSLSGASPVDQTLATQTLLAAIAERGSDAVGYAYRGPGLPLAVHKQRGGASALLDGLAVPARGPPGARARARLHEGSPQPRPPTTTRSATERSSASTTASSRTTRRSSRGHGFERAEPGMTVDSEAIFALAEEASSALRRARGAARLDGGGLAGRARPGDRSISPAGSAARSGSARASTSSSSPRRAGRSSSSSATPACVCASASSARARLLSVADGVASLTASFEPDRTFVEDALLPPVRAPEEARSCLARLAVIATAAAAAR